ncbi:MAG TPA: hypothetical protein VD838_15315 [Anaeromyxobacteraceae bacterium]|nr:hypothetical protein [Anaeromyxobacteraceae bacterium]
MILIALAGIALVNYAGNDRVDAARFGVKDRGLACAEAGIQYARRFFGSTYAQSNNWNDYLVTPTSAVPGYRYDENATPPDAYPNLADVPKQTRGMSNETTFDAGADIDGDGNADFWVSVRDDDDERPLGAPHDPARDNNETIVIRSECTNEAYAIIEGGEPRHVVLETALSHVQGSSGYGIAAGGSNSPDLVGGAP